MLRPRGVNMHYEVELGLIMGKTVRDLHPEDTKRAMDAIEGNIHLIISVGPTRFTTILATRLQILN